MHYVLMSIVFFYLIFNTIGLEICFIKFFNKFFTNNNNLQERSTSFYHPLSYPQRSFIYSLSLGLAICEIKFKLLCWNPILSFGCGVKIKLSKFAKQEKKSTKLWPIHH